MRYRAPGRQTLVAAVLTILAFAADTPNGPAHAQAADEVELTVRLDVIASRDEAPSGDVTIEFTEASTREPVASYSVEAAEEEQTFQLVVPALSRDPGGSQRRGRCGRHGSGTDRAGSWGSGHRGLGDTLAAIADRGQVQTDGDEFVVMDLAPGTYSYCLPDGVCTRVDIVPWAESRVRD